MTFLVLESIPHITRANDVARTEVSISDDSKCGPAPRCERCGGFIGMLTWLPPYRVEMETWGQQFGDLAFSGLGADFLVSERFKELYASSGLTGLSGFEPVQVLRVRKHKQFDSEPPQYFKVTVGRTEAKVDQDASVFEWEISPTCPVCRIGLTFKRRKGVVILPGTWTGEDIFIPQWLPGNDFITTLRFKEFCDRNVVTNAIFYLAETHACDLYSWEARKSTER